MSQRTPGYNQRYLKPSTLLIALFIITIKKHTNHLHKTLTIYLLLQGHKLSVYDISAPACAALKAKGATVCANQQDVAKDADFVITMLPNNDIVSNTYETIATKGTISKNTIFIDSSTIDPNVAKSVRCFEFNYFIMLSIILF